MSNLGPQFDRAQRQYDNASPPDDDACEDVCDQCQGKRDGDGDPVECKACDSTGVVEKHAWRCVRRDAEVALMRCQRCGAEDVD